MSSCKSWGGKVFKYKWLFVYKSFFLRLLFWLYAWWRYVRFSPKKRIFLNVNNSWIARVKNWMNTFLRPYNPKDFKNHTYITRQSILLLLAIPSTVSLLIKHWLMMIFQKKNSNFLYIYVKSHKFWKF